MMGPRVWAQSLLPGLLRWDTRSCILLTVFFVLHSSDLVPSQSTFFYAYVSLCLYDDLLDVVWGIFWWRSHKAPGPCSAHRGRSLMRSGYLGFQFGWVQPWISLDIARGFASASASCPSDPWWSCSASGCKWIARSNTRSSHRCYRLSLALAGWTSRQHPTKYRIEKLVPIRF